MKKAYTKPKLYVETFELLEHIASCTAKPGTTTVNYRDGYSCTYTDANVTLFYAANGSCGEGGWDTEMFDDLDAYLDSFGGDRGGCYNAFGDGNFFAS